MAKVTITIEGDFAQDAMQEVCELASIAGFGSARADPAAVTETAPPKNKGGRPPKAKATAPEAPVVEDVFSQPEPTTAPAEIAGAVAPSVDDMFGGSDTADVMSEADFMAACKATVDRANNQGPNLKAIQDAAVAVAGTKRFKDVAPEKRAAVVEAFEALKF